MKVKIKAIRTSKPNAKWKTCQRFGYTQLYSKPNSVCEQNQQISQVDLKPSVPEERVMLKEKNYRNSEPPSVDQEPD